MQIVNPTVVQDPNTAFVNANLGLRNGILSPFASTLAEGAAKGLGNLVFGPSLDDQLKQVRLREANQATLDQIFRESGEGHAKAYAQRELGMDDDEVASTMSRLHDNARLAAQRGVYVSQAQAQGLPVNIAPEEKASWDPNRGAPAAPGQSVKGGSAVGAGGSNVDAAAAGGERSLSVLGHTAPPPSTGNPTQDLTGAPAQTAPGQPPALEVTPAALEATPAFFPSGQQSTVDQRKAFAENEQKAPQALQELSQSVTPRTMMAYHAQTARLIGALGMMRASAEQDPTKMTPQVAMLANMTQDNYNDFLAKIQLESGVTTDGLKKMGLQGVADSNIWMQMRNPQTAEQLRQVLGPQKFAELQAKMPEIAERVARAGISPTEQAMWSHVLGGSLGQGPDGIKNAEILARAAAITSTTRREEDLHPYKVKQEESNTGLLDTKNKLAALQSPLIVAGLQQELRTAGIDEKQKAEILKLTQELHPLKLQEAEANLKELRQKIAQSADSFGEKMTSERVDRLAKEIAVQSMILKSENAPTDAVAAKEALNYQSITTKIEDSRAKLNAARMKMAQGFTMPEQKRETETLISTEMSHLADLEKQAQVHKEAWHVASAEVAARSGKSGKEMRDLLESTFKNPKSTALYWENQLDHGIGMGTPVQPTTSQIGLVVDVASIGAKKGIKLSHEQFLSEIQKKYGSQIDKNNVVTPNALWMIYEKQYEDARKRK